MKATGTCGICEMLRTHENQAFAGFVCWVPFVVKASAMSCRNQIKSNQIRPNQTIIFFRTKGADGKSDSPAFVFHMGWEWRLEKKLLDGAQLG